MNFSVAPAETSSDWRHRALAITDASRLLALATLAVLGPALHALAAGRLARLTAGEQQLCPARLVLLHVALAGLLCSGLHILPLAQWSAAVSPLAEAACRMGRAATDALYATQSILLTAALLSLLRRPPGLLLAVVLVLLWLVGPGLNFGHVHWRAAAGAPYEGPFVESAALFVREVDIDAVIAAAGRDAADDAVTAAAATSEATTDEAAAAAAAVDAAVAAAGAVSADAEGETEGEQWLAGCVQEEDDTPLWRQSRAQAAAAALPLLLAVPCLLLLGDTQQPLRPVLAALGVVRAAGCCGQLLVLALAAGRPAGGLLEATAGVLRDAGLLLEATLLLVLYRPPRPPPPGPVRILVQDQCIGPSPPRDSRRPHRTRAAAKLWQRPRTDSSSWTFSETW